MSNLNVMRWVVLCVYVFILKCIRIDTHTPWNVLLLLKVFILIFRHEKSVMVVCVRECMYVDVE